MGRKLYVVGGWSGQTGLAKCEVYDMDLQKWAPIACLKTGAISALLVSSALVHVMTSSCVVTTCISVAECALILILDRNILAVCVQTTTMGARSFELPFSSFSALVLLSCCCAAGRSQTGLCVLHGRLIAVGGGDSWQCLNTVEMYDPAENRWSYLPPLATARRGAGIALFKGACSQGRTVRGSIATFWHWHVLALRGWSQKSPLVPTFQSFSNHLMLIEANWIAKELTKHKNHQHALALVSSGFAFRDQPRMCSRTRKKIHEKCHDVLICPRICTKTSVRSTFQPEQCKVKCRTSNFVTREQGVQCDRQRSCMGHDLCCRQAVRGWRF